MQHLACSERIVIRTRYLLPCLLTGLLGCGGGAEPAALRSPAGPGAALPHLSQGPDGQVVLSWVGIEAEQATLQYAVLQDGRWQAPVTVASGINWFLNWADFPSVVYIRDTLWAAHWLQKNGSETYAYDVMLAQSLDGGRTWTSGTVAHDDATATEHGFASLFPTDNGFGALWLDGRNMAPASADATPGPMTLRAAEIHAQAGEIRQWEVDSRVCDCCQTDVAVGSRGPVAVYRDRTKDEIRDIYVTRLTDNGWLPGRTVAADGWHITGCPVNGPAIAARGDTVVVAWFTAARGHSRVRLARSADGGETFSAPQDIDSDQPMGRVDVVLLEDGDAVVSWLRRGARSPGEIVARRVSPAAPLGPIRVIAETTGTRPSGFPQMAHTQESLVFAWTDTAQEQVKTAQFAIAHLSSP